MSRVHIRYSSDEIVQSHIFTPKRGYLVLCKAKVHGDLSVSATYIHPKIKGK